MEAIDVRGGIASEGPDGDERVAEPRQGTYREIGRYLLCDEIASGGMATVHLGCLLGAGGFARTVAVKRLFPQFARDPEFVAMFLDEARLAARIFHPNVISVLDVVEDGPDLFLVMDYVRGAPLSLLNRRARERGAPAPAPVAARILADALSGLHAAHEALDAAGERLEIVHRDVSPQNILVGSDGVARVFDFGVAKAAGRLQTTRAGQLKGKLSYMAPEQVSDESVSRLTDIYAASVMYWETLTGQRLFQSPDERTTLTKILALPVRAPSSLVRGLPPALDRVVLRGLDRDPARRYATAHDMVADITKYSRMASPAEVGAWVASLAKVDLDRHARLAAEIERLPPAEGALEFAERLALAARHSSTRAVAYARTSSFPADVTPRPSSPSLSRLDSLSSVPRLASTPSLTGLETASSAIPARAPPAVSSSTAPRTERPRHVVAAFALAIIVGAAPTVIGRCFARASHGVASPATLPAVTGGAAAAPPRQTVESAPTLDRAASSPPPASRSACQRAAERAGKSPSSCP